MKTIKSSRVSVKNANLRSSRCWISDIFLNCRPWSILFVMGQPSRTASNINVDGNSEIRQFFRFVIYFICKSLCLWIVYTEEEKYYRFREKVNLKKKKNRTKYRIRIVYLKIFFFFLGTYYCPRNCKTMEYLFFIVYPPVENPGSIKVVYIMTLRRLEFLWINEKFIYKILLFSIYSSHNRNFDRAL